MGQILKTDIYQTPMGEIAVTPVAHSSVMMKFGGKVIHIDPYTTGTGADYTVLPPADLLLITHDHYDHFDAAALKYVISSGTRILSTSSTAAKLDNVEVLYNGDSTRWEGVTVTAVPAYNIFCEVEPGKPLHPRGYGNGYILDFGGFTVYAAGDTECIEEMKKLGKIDVAFLPKTPPFTMGDDEFIEAARTIRPKVLYPYHYLSVDKKELQSKLPGILIR